MSTEKRDQAIKHVNEAIAQLGSAFDFLQAEHRGWADVVWQHHMDLREFVEVLAPAALLSRCCGAEMRVEGKTTQHWVCVTCGNPTDPGSDV